MEKESPEEFQKRWLGWLVVVMAVGACFAMPVFAALYVGRNLWSGTWFVLGLPGRPFGKKWFAARKRLVWKTNFLAMPPDDVELAKWVAAQPDVFKSSVTREPYWVIFDCTLRGYFLDTRIKMASVRKAQSLGYDTGGRVAFLDIME